MEMQLVRLFVGQTFSSVQGMLKFRFTAELLAVACACTDFDKFSNRMVACHAWASIACHGHICALAKTNLQDSNRFWHLLFSIWCCWIGTTASRQCNLSDKACLRSAFYHVVNEGSIEGVCFRLGSLYWRVQACT